jgi:ribosomal protein S18 acetylase RimI-like enzyme
MRRDLANPGASPSLPDGLTIRTFTPADAMALHALLDLAYEQGGGGVLPFDVWWPSLRDDPEFAEDICWLVEDAEGRIVGAAQCWTTGFIKDLVVHPDYRRRNIASCLLSIAFAGFASRGLRQVDLKVFVDNAAAISLYGKHGMRPA